MNVRLDFCSLEAATFAVRCWHYTKSMPASRRVCIGVWEQGAFIGAIVFSRGNTPNIGTPYGLTQAQVCELTRVALREHVTPTSRLLAIAVRLLRRQSPALRLLVSYADPAHGHVGTLYQAAGWWHLGTTHRECLLRVHGRLVHPRTTGSKFGHRGIAWLRQHVDPHAERLIVPEKFKYGLPLDDDMRARLLPLVRPYPKRERSADSGTAGPPAGDGAHPIRSLHTEAAYVG
jgi:hypothetical protein